MGLETIEALKASWRSSLAHGAYVFFSVIWSPVQGAPIHPVLSWGFPFISGVCGLLGRAGAFG